MFDYTRLIEEKEETESKSLTAKCKQQLDDGKEVAGNDSGCFNLPEHILT